ncbi:MAG TPA: hypothetical protein VFO86_05465 [Terriglobia bacterium]|nr:hypothetical protein [Terriglobia bacterium]
MDVESTATRLYSVSRTPYKIETGADRRMNGIGNTIGETVRDVEKLSAAVNREKDILQKSISADDPLQELLEASRLLTDRLALALNDLRVLK